MNKEELISRLKPIVATYTQNKEALETINEDTNFIKDLKINSASLVDVILDVEEEFGIEIDNLSMEKMLTVGAAMDIVETKLNELDRK